MRRLDGARRAQPLSEPKYGGAMSFKEIADAMGCTPQNVNMIYKHALAKLRRSGRMRELLALARQKEISEV